MSKEINSEVSEAKGGTIKRAVKTLGAPPLTPRTHLHWSSTSRSNSSQRSTTHASFSTRPRPRPLQLPASILLLRAGHHGGPQETQSLRCARWLYPRCQCAEYAGVLWPARCRTVWHAARAAGWLSAAWRSSCESCRSSREPIPADEYWRATWTAWDPPTASTTGRCCCCYEQPEPAVSFVCDIKRE